VFVCVCVCMSMSVPVPASMSLPVYVSVSVYVSVWKCVFVSHQLAHPAGVLRSMVAYSGRAAAARYSTPPLRTSRPTIHNFAGQSE